MINLGGIGARAKKTLTDEKLSNVSGIIDTPAKCITLPEIIDTDLHQQEKTDQ